MQYCQMMLLPIYLPDISKKYSTYNSCGYTMSIEFGNVLRYLRYFKETFNSNFCGTSRFMCIVHSGLCLGTEKMRRIQSVFLYAGEKK